MTARMTAMEGDGKLPLNANAEGIAAESRRREL